ncbi:DsrE family protein [Pectinatus haikarae]|uniref:Intracellular sulfur oxidation DsrE/DsrF family protein n=1 Tax=Pectinatus haikarae TaxID=349096 RepID=A0ABT9YAH1_9FIRM|nr:DsrE family protein [Pectinatus haikarae]MDQ0204731.1 intracellular sulfur oxidation DsrE/DsrF family protein [Pectinatus haikarae]
MRILKAAFHIDEINKWQMLCNNIRNLIGDINTHNYEIKVVVNGDAVNIFSQKDSSDLLHELEKLVHEKVEFLLCRNALHGNNINESALPQSVKVIPAGVTKLVELQVNGYAYIKP